jgi:spore coat protein H
VIISIALLLCSWRIGIDAATYFGQSGNSMHSFLWNLTNWNSNPVPISDNTALYDPGLDDVVHTIYLTVLPEAGVVQNDNEAVQNQSGFEDIRSDFEMMNLITDYKQTKPVLPVIFIDGDDPEQLKNLSDYDYSGQTNATVTLRGHSTLTALKKSYKIRLNAENKPWLGQMTINLNKHPNDESRIRNKIAFDIFRFIPDLTSMQTSMVRLYVRDLSGSASNINNEPFVDYGIFTQIEQANQDFLKAHYLDENGSLYKANSFEFYQYESALRNIDDPDYNKAEFEDVLEICAGSSHEKLIQMLKDLNNYELDIDDILDRYFNRDNYFTWLAVNILLSNYDTQTQNFFLYSPHDSLTWYFLPWDYDGSMIYRTMTDTDGDSAQLFGISNYWNAVLHRRVFEKPDNLNQLCEKIESVYRILSSGVINERILLYKPLIEQYYLNNQGFCKEISPEEFYEELDCISKVVDLNYKTFYKTLGKPMPVFLGVPEILNPDESDIHEVVFRWTGSFDLQNDLISYKLEISKDIDFKNIVISRSNLRKTEYIAELPAGDYFWRIKIMDDEGNSQRAFDIYWPDGEPHNIHTGNYGVAYFSVGV